MKQTAVEWLIEQFETIVFYSEEAKEDTINQAKEMEKQQQDEFAIGFAEWILRNFNNYGPNDEKELLEIYKKEKDGSK